MPPCPPVCRGDAPVLAQRCFRFKTTSENRPVVTPSVYPRFLSCILIAGFIFVLTLCFAFAGMTVGECLASRLASVFIRVLM